MSFDFIRKFFAPPDQSSLCFFLPDPSIRSGLLEHIRCKVGTISAATPFFEEIPNWSFLFFELNKDEKEYVYIKNKEREKALFFFSFFIA